MDTTFELANYVNGLASGLYRIETSTVAKGKSYYGARISPEYGFESIRSDLMARTVMNADLFAMQKGDGTGNWYNKLYFDPVEGLYIFDGLLSATTIEAIKAEIDIVISNTIIVNNLTAEKGYIADLTVDEINTSDKVERYIREDTSICGYFRGHAQNIEFIEARYNPILPPEQVSNRSGHLLYWLDGTFLGVTEDVTDFPVMQYAYTETTKMKLYNELDPVTGYTLPKISFGAGSLSGKMKGYIYKDSNEFILSYENIDGEMREIRLGEDGITMNPPLLIFPDAFNATEVEADSETALQGIAVTFRPTTRVAFDVQMDVTASEAMTLTVKARIAGVEHRRTVKYFAGAYTDGICFNGLFDVVNSGERTVDITITPSSGTATISIEAYRLMLTIRDGSSEEAAAWPVANVSDMLVISDSLRMTDSLSLAIDSRSDIDTADYLSLTGIGLSDVVDIVLV
jgi:hypothetical protein